ncbi:MAG: alpha/beta fold hydrolase, partial [Chloroflexi bacterium]|nr:alpha/beta fold hydrolase [Chloroflexota bacterium]
MTIKLRDVLFAIAALLGLGFIWLVLRYRRWLAQVTEQASAESQIIQTRLGPVEYDRRGAGPVLLHFHGGNVGHKGWFTVAHLVEAGFQLLTPDRPGYLGTPLGDNGSPEAQADLMAALLDALDIEQVAVIGAAAGGPGALQFALRH